MTTINAFEDLPEETREKMSTEDIADYEEERCIIKKVNDGEMSFIDYQKWLYQKQQRKYAPLLLDYCQSDQWEKFVDLATSVWEIMPIAFQLFDVVPDHLKYDFAISAYIDHGDSIPAVREAVRKCGKYGKAKLPEELASAPEITVYRAGEETITKAPYRLSWTTSEDIANFFLREYSGRHAKYLYRAKIRPDKVIAYIDERNEKEIVQYRNVYDVEIIDTIE